MVLPKDACRFLGWIPGDTVKITVVNSGMYIEKAASGTPDELVKEGETVK